MTKEIKLSFHLDSEEGWPPYSIENLWFEKTTKAGEYCLASLPFFVKGVAVGDVVKPMLDESGDVTSFDLVSSSKSSTIWIRANNSTVLEEVSNQLRGLKLRFERFDHDRLLSAELKSDRCLEELDIVLNPLVEKDSVFVAYPCLRHKG